MNLHQDHTVLDTQSTNEQLDFGKKLEGRPCAGEINLIASHYVLRGEVEPSSLRVFRGKNTLFGVDVKRIVYSELVTLMYMHA